MKKIASIILAAGGSRRLGRPKQLLYYRGQTLIHRAADAALNAGCDPVIVVIGAASAECAVELCNLPVELACNADWPLGLGGSIAKGIAAVPRDCDAVIVSLCDQIHVTAHGLRALIETHIETGALIVASQYAQKLGAPALFDASIFPELARLRGDEGASHVMLRHRGEVHALPHTAAQIDIDTKADCERYGVEEDEFHTASR